MVTLKINGITHEVDVQDDTPLLWVLRDTLSMTGTKYGCGISACGACTVYLDGQPVQACTLPISSAVGKEIITIEGLNSKVGQAVQATWRRLNVVQCGYCQSGQIMAATALLASNPKPTDANIDAAMGLHVCRCATYQRIRTAIHETAKSLS